MIRETAFAFACCLLVATAPPLSAAQSDADFLAAEFLAADGMLLLEEGAAKGKADVFGRWLGERAVKVIDPSGLADAMGAVPDPVFREQMHGLFKARCLSPFSDAELRAAADYVRREGVTQAPNAGTGEPNLNAAAKELRAAAAFLDTDAGKVGLGAAICIVQLSVQITNHMRAQAKVEDSKDPERLIGLLGRDDIFEFPNRIVRRRVVDELRSLSR